ncbi:MAG: hypothetical protein R3C49_03680 [Planctomycetaceae bacterium]
MSSRFLKRIFDGSLNRLVLNMLQAEDVSAEERRELERLIAKARLGMFHGVEHIDGRMIDSDFPGEFVRHQFPRWCSACKIAPNVGSVHTPIRAAAREGDCGAQEKCVRRVCRFFSKNLR